MKIELGLFHSARCLLLFKLHLRNCWSFEFEVKTYGFELRIFPLVNISWGKYHQNGPSIVNLYARHKRELAKTAEFFASLDSK